MSNDNLPLVSVCVVSYNSAETIQETLNSVGSQTYKNIELLISDDCSTDLTINVVKDWVEINKKRFYDVQILESIANQGVAQNCNKACLCSNGKYIKLIGADDILLPNYISDCVSFFAKNIQEKVLFTKIIAFRDYDKSNVVELKENYDFLKMNTKKQFNWVKIHSLPLLPTAAVIYEREILEKMNFFDIRIPMWEDGPMYFKLLKEGIHLAFLDVNGVLYRVRSNSISNGRSLSHLKSELLYFKYYSLQYEILYNPIKFFYHFFKILLFCIKNKTLI